MQYIIVVQTPFSPVYMEASLAATGIFDVLATNAVRFMMDSSTPPISVLSYKRRKIAFIIGKFGYKLYWDTVVLNTSVSHSKSDSKFRCRASKTFPAIGFRHHWNVVKALSSARV